MSNPTENIGTPRNRWDKSLTKNSSFVSNSISFQENNSPRIKNNNIGTIDTDDGSLPLFF